MKRIKNKISILLICLIIIISIPGVQANCATVQQQSVVDEAFKHLGAPYQWAAEGPNSFDCSGFTQYVYKVVTGINIGRTTSNQVDSGIEVSVNNLQPGDLVFPNPGHVQIYIGNGQVIHAPHSGDIVSVASLGNVWRARRIITSNSEIENDLFDAVYYADTYPDLKNTYGYDTNALYNHWINYGINEGRTASPIYDPHYYLEHNPDVKAVFGTNYQAVYNHFVTNGYNEGRQASVVFNVNYYKNTYSDLSSLSNIALFNHFYRNGMNEGRTGSAEFQPNNYKNRYSDLSQMYGNDMKKYYWHYLNCGRNEGRIGN